MVLISALTCLNRNAPNAATRLVLEQSTTEWSGNWNFRVNSPGFQTGKNCPQRFVWKPELRRQFYWVLFQINTAIILGRHIIHKMEMQTVNICWACTIFNPCFTVDRSTCNRKYLMYNTIVFLLDHDSNTTNYKLSIHLHRATPGRDSFTLFRNGCVQTNCSKHRSGTI